MTRPDDIVETPVTDTPKSWLSRIQEGATLVRDIGVILGIPAIIAVGLKLYDIQQQAFDAQAKANEATIKSLETQISVLKETQFDHALSLIKSQTEVFSIERQALTKQLSAIAERDTKRFQWMDQIFKIETKNAEGTTAWMQALDGIFRKATKDPTFDASKALANLKLEQFFTLEKPPKPPP